MDTHVDLHPIIQSLIGLLAFAITTFGSFVLYRLGQVLGLKKDDQNMQMLDTIMTRAIQAGAMQAQDIISVKGWDNPDVHNVIIANGLNYASEKFPDMLAKMGLDPKDPACAKAIEDVLWRILPTALQPVAASAATPPTPENKPAAILQ